MLSRNCIKLSLDRQGASDNEVGDYCDYGDYEDVGTPVVPTRVSLNPISNLLTYQSLWLVYRNISHLIFQSSTPHHFNIADGLAEGKNGQTRLNQIKPFHLLVLNLHLRDGRPKAVSQVAAVSLRQDLKEDQPRTAGQQKVLLWPFSGSFPLRRDIMKICQHNQFSGQRSRSSTVCL